MKSKMKEKNLERIKASLIKKVCAALLPLLLIILFYFF